MQNAILELMNWSLAFKNLAGFIVGSLLISILCLLPEEKLGTAIFIAAAFALWLGFLFFHGRWWSWTLLFLPAAGSVALLLSERSHLYPHYLFSAGLAYLILLSFILMGLNRWIFKQPYSLKAHFQKRYLLYGLGCFALLWATTTMDKSDPLGPHFQLKVMVWILFTVLVFNWFLGHFKWIRGLESAKTEAELSNLKNQIHPHFLFNTLNNIYGLAREKSDLAPEMILKLSDLLRYGVHHATHQQVPLEKEMEHLQNFLDLQSLRYHHLRLNLQLDIEEKGVTVSPLIFLPLVENAFKHGVDLMPEAQVDILLKATAEQVNFRVVNDRPKAKEPEAKGTGLANLKKRLELNYPNRHYLKLQFEGDKAMAELELRL